ncbi:2746_t:CDS:2 [Acaulospora colombiana]|uniref:2746_t:CDS:1 n=1 Tax=Acaulospora colombiana TaxID=27376 RepID=A0ACA9KRB9_9GLOM|nr:2746_t:CDS:2 [Acaulospora colombiana]
MALTTCCAGDSYPRTFRSLLDSRGTLSKRLIGKPDDFSPRSVLPNDLGANKLARRSQISCVGRDNLKFKRDTLRENVGRGISKINNAKRDKLWRGITCLGKTRRSDTFPRDNIRRGIVHSDNMRKRQFGDGFVDGGFGDGGFVDGGFGDGGFIDGGFGDGGFIDGGFGDGGFGDGGFGDGGFGDGGFMDGDFIDGGFGGFTDEIGETEEAGYTSLVKKEYYTSWFNPNVGQISIAPIKPEFKGEKHKRYSVGFRLAFNATCRVEIDDFHDFLVEKNYTVLNAPKEYSYVPGYYAVSWEDPDGLELELCYVPISKNVISEGKRLDDSTKEEENGNKRQKVE